MAWTGPGAKVAVIVVISLAILIGFIYGMVVLFSSSDISQLTFRPLPKEGNPGSKLIWYSLYQYYQHTNHYVEDLSGFVKPYTEERYRSNAMHCSDNRTANPEHGEYCLFDLASLGDKCTEAQAFGYPQGDPCVFIMMKNNTGWVPEVYDSLDDIPENMPHDLQNHIYETTKDNGGIIPRMLWISCTGEYGHDRDWLWAIDYYPYPGIPAYYFPYMDTPGYLSPIVAIRLRPRLYVLTSITCRAWAKNTKHTSDDYHNTGTTPEDDPWLLNFQILINHFELVTTQLKT